MPYYVFEITSPDGMSMVKNLNLIEVFDKFKDAKHFAREQRAKLEDSKSVTIKVMFAENQLIAEEQLLEHREKPIVMEHEK